MLDKSSPTAAGFAAVDVEHDGVSLPAVLDVGTKTCDDTGVTIQMRGASVSPADIDVKAEPPPPISAGLTYRQLDEDFGAEGVAEPTFKATCARRARSFFCKRSPSQLLLKYLPFIDTLRHYDLRHNLLPDVLAGLSVSVLHTGQGLGFAVLAGLPPAYGIYVSFFHSLVYFFFGTSRHLSVGTHSLSSLIIGAAVAREAGALASAATATTVSPGDNITHSGIYASVTDVTATYNATTIADGGGDKAAADEQLESLKLGVATTLSVLVGVFQLALGLLRIGSLLSGFISPAFVGGFTCAASFHIASSQLKYVAFGKLNYIGSYSGPLKLYYLWRDFFVNFLHINWVCSVCFLCSLALLLAVKMGINKNPRFRHRLPVPLPVDLLVIVLFTLLSYYLAFDTLPDVATGVVVVGRMPTGLPAPTVPAFPVGGDWLARLAADAVALAIIGHLFNYAMAALFSEKYRYRVDYNQELLAAGLCHTIGAFFGCFAGCASPPRCFLQDAAGGRTRLAGLACCAALALVVYALGPYLYHLPYAVVAALICVSLKRLMLQLRDIRALWRQDGIDCIVWLATFVATFVLDIELGMLVGLGSHVLMATVRPQLIRPYAIGALPQTAAALKATGSEQPLYEDAKAYAGVESVVRLGCGGAGRDAAVAVALRYDCPIVYLNCERLVRQATKRIDRAIAEQQLQRLRSSNSGDDVRQPVRAMVLDCSHVGYIDTAGAKGLAKLRTALSDRGVDLLFAACSPSMRLTLADVPATQAFSDRLFVTVHDALRYAAVASATAAAGADDDGVDKVATPLEPSKELLTAVVSAAEASAIPVTCGVGSGGSTFRE